MIQILHRLDEVGAYPSIVAEHDVLQVGRGTDHDHRNGLQYRVSFEDLQRIAAIGPRPAQVYDDG